MGRSRDTRRRRYVIGFGALLLVGVLTLNSDPAVGTAPATGDFEVQSLDGSGNNQTRPERGQAGTPYRRASAATYADGRSAVVELPNAGTSLDFRKAPG